MEGLSRCRTSRRKWQGIGPGKYPPRAEPANHTGPFPREPCGNGRLVPQGPGPPPQRVIQRRHLVPGSAGKLVGASDSENRGPLCGM